jgi:Spy/CpxP family protein refolding chaperone
MRPTCKLAALLLVVVASVTVLAQPDRPGDKAGQRLAQFKKLRLIETLELDEKTAEKFFVRYNEGQKKIDEARKQLREAVRQLDDAVRAKVSDTELKSKSDQVIKRVQEFSTAIVDRLESVRPLLNPEQYAKLVVFEVRFTEALQRALMERGALPPAVERNRRPPHEGSDPAVERDRRRRRPLEEPD